MHTIENYFPRIQLEAGNNKSVTVPNLSTMIPETVLQRLRASALASTKQYQSLYQTTNELKVAVHIRRGDIRRDDQLRVVPISYYVRIIDHIRKVYPRAEVHVFSSLETNHFTKNDFKGISTMSGVTMHYDEAHALLAWSNFLRADVFVMGRGGFSMVPALAHSGCVVYDALNWQGKLAHWITGETVGNENELKHCIESAKNISSHSTTPIALNQ